jgi:two-component system nitrate/nitrite response regulator NarL
VIEQRGDRSTPLLGRLTLLSTMPVIEGIVRAAATAAESDAVVVTGDVASALAALDEQPDAVVVVDLDDPAVAGADPLRAIRRAHLAARPIVLSSRVDGAAVLEMVRLGARAYVRTPDDLPDLPQILLRVAGGGWSVAFDLEETVVSEFSSYVRRIRQSAHHPGVTRRQREILGLLAQGLTVSQIGRRLAISPRTVETHIANLYRRMSVRTRMQAITQAASLGIIEVR